MTDPETTFTVEVLGFASEADPEVLAGSVSEFFGIPIEEGRRLVKKRPIRVKRRASAAVAQQLVKQLRRLGADVLVRNEQSGEERTYHAKKAAAKLAEADDAPEPVSSIESIPGAQPGAVRPEIGPASIKLGDSIPPMADRREAEAEEETLESADSEIPTEAVPNVEIVTAAPISKSPRTDRSPGATPEAPPSSDPERPSRDSIRGPLPSAPGVDARRRRSNTPFPLEGRAKAASDPGTEAPLETAEAPAHRPQSLPPPSAPMQAALPPSTAGKLDFCGSCNRPVEKGDTCAKCGWNNGEKERRCRQCKNKLSIVSVVTRTKVASGLFAAAVIAIGAIVVVLLGPFAGVASALAAAAFVVLGDALTVRYSCRTCTVAVYSERLMKEEEVRIGRARKKGFALSAVSLVLGGALFAGSGAASHEIVDSSYGITWKLRVPGTHSHITGEVAQIVVPSGNKYARVQLAERPYLGGQVYFLIHYQHSLPAGPAELDKPAIAAGAAQVVKVYFGGQIAGELTANGDAFDGAFTGTFHNRPVYGRLRATQHEHDMVIVAITSSVEADLKDPSIAESLSALSVQRAAK